MSQYCPVYRAGEFKEIDRRLTKYEYKKVADTAVSLGFYGFLQDTASHESAFTPEFDGTGVN